MHTEERYMKRALQLAQNGLGATAPNPSVGVVIVYNERIIGEGYTSAYGGPHAEVNAINSVKDKELLKESTIYVTLEPCSHHGKTPPCADLIIKNKFPHIVIGILDPHLKVAGKGKQMMEKAGCKVTLGVLKDECTTHHKRFLSFHSKNRPYIILKWAETKDGFIAPGDDIRKEFAPVWITNKTSRQLVHKWRSEEQAILVGTRTVLKDNPKLNVRTWTGKNPTRIVIDKELALKSGYNILDAKQETIIITQIGNPSPENDHITYEYIDFEEYKAKQICDILYKHNITSVIIEGGAKTIEYFIQSGIWDEARVFKGDALFGSGVKAPNLKSTPVKSVQIETDTLNYYIND